MMDGRETSLQRVIARYRASPVPLLLRCGVQHYDWGGTEQIPALLGIENRNRKPFAELWVGAHPDLPSTANLDGVEVPLDALFAAAGEVLMGAAMARRFAGELPFLLKILSARKPLSVQVHPHAAQAREGFERENRLGIPLGDPRRSYHDPHHKPELLVALTDFHALRGFRPLSGIAMQLQSTPELAPLARRFQPHRASLRGLYEHVMRMPQTAVDAILEPLLQRLRERHATAGLNTSEPDYWALRAGDLFNRDGHSDRGIFSIYLLNLIRLRPGEAIYLPAGELHAYLEGTGVEVMANSNNVLRGGLTSKHVDVDQLLRTLSFNCGEPRILGPAAQGRSGIAEKYVTPAPEFELVRLNLPSAGLHAVAADHSVQLALVTQGSVRLDATAAAAVTVPKGHCVLIPGGQRYRLSARDPAQVFVAGVPAGRNTSATTGREGDAACV